MLSRYHHYDDDYYEFCRKLQICFSEVDVFDNICTLFRMLTKWRHFAQSYTSLLNVAKKAIGQSLLLDYYYDYGDDYHCYHDHYDDDFYHDYYYDYHYYYHDDGYYYDDDYDYDY